MYDIEAIGTVYPTGFFNNMSDRENAVLHNR